MKKKLIEPNELEVGDVVRSEAFQCARENDGVIEVDGRTTTVKNKYTLEERLALSAKEGRVVPEYVPDTSGRFDPSRAKKTYVVVETSYRSFTILVGFNTKVLRELNDDGTTGGEELIVSCVRHDFMFEGSCAAKFVGEIFLVEKRIPVTKYLPK